MCKVGYYGPVIIRPTIYSEGEGGGGNNTEEAGGVKNYPYKKGGGGVALWEKF